MRRFQGSNSIIHYFFLLSILLTSCGEKEKKFVIPNPPDLTQDIEAFNKPDADLNQENILSAINNAQNTYQFIQQLKIFQPLLESIFNSLGELSSKDGEKNQKSASEQVRFLETLE